MRLLHRAGVAAIFVVLLLAPVSAAALSAPVAPPHAAPASAADERPATDLRVALSRLLGEHAYLVMETMRAASLGQGEEAALRVALDDNSAQLRGAIASVYGDAGGDGFGVLWDEHVDLLLAYADAGRRNDAAAAAEAQQGLDEYVAKFSNFLAAANPEFHAHDEAAALNLHVGQLTEFAEGDYDQAYESQRAAFGHMFELGDHLALGIARQFPDRFPDGAIAFSPRSDLRLTLDRLLAEHLILASEAMRAGVGAAPDFDPGTDALDANTGDLAAAVGSVYGDEAGAAFRDLWQAHVGAYVTFVEALGSGDEAARESSLMELHGYHDQVAEFLSTANPNLDRDDVAVLISRHVQALISQAEATDAGDHERAVATTREAYAAMFDVGAALADAIVLQFPDRFEDLRELPGTSTDGASRFVGSSPGTGLVAIAAVIAMLAGAAAFLVRGMRSRDGPHRGR